MTQLQLNFGPQWATVASYDFDGRTFYVGHDVVRILGLRSTTWSIRRKISRSNWIMRFIEDVNRGRAVYLVDFQGVLEIIMYNNSAVCNEIKPCIVSYLAQQGMDDFRLRPLRIVALNEELRALDLRLQQLNAA